MNYNDFKNYAIKYYLRFYPSKNKLISKLTTKFKISFTDAKKIIQELQNDGIIIEEKVIEEKIKYLISKGKNINYIKINLLKKEFDKNILFEKLNNLSEKGTILEDNFIINKILSYKEKNKSKNYIRRKLIERQEDKLLVNNLIEEHYTAEEELENLKINYNKIKNMGKSNKQILDNLVGKGFYLRDILEIVKK